MLAICDSLSNMIIYTLVLEKGSESKHIQDFLSVENGDFAGRFFSGQKYDMMVRILSQYIKEELKQPQ
jgi:hypothetical protein